MMNNQSDDNYQYDPNNLFDVVMRQLNIKNDAALSKTLNVSPATISKIRHLKLRIGGSMLIRMHELTNYSIKDLRGLMGDYREEYSDSRKNAPNHV